MPSNPIDVYLIYEDLLQKEIIEKILSGLDKKYCIKYSRNTHGFGVIKKNINVYNSASAESTYIVVIDLDTDICASSKISSWLNSTKSDNLLLRVAVKTIESWMIADKSHLQTFLGIRRDCIPDNVDQISHPRTFLFDLIRRSRNKRLIRDVCPRGTARFGPLYNETLSTFIRSSWDPNLAKLHSPSLRRTIARFESYTPNYS